MSDTPRRPEDQQNPSSSTGGWRQPDPSSGGWRAVERAERAAPQRQESSQRTGWKTPTLPRNLNAKPGESGAWHLPSPEDTTITTLEDAEVEAVAAEQAAPAEAVLPLEDSEAVNVLPFEEEKAADASSALPTLDEDEDDASVSMSELIALASLVDNPPQTAASSAAAAQAAIDDPNDPAAYARRQLEQLRTGLSSDTGTAQMEATGAVSPFEASATESAALNAATDPAAYARAQLEKLSASQRMAAIIEPESAIGTPAIAPAAPAAALTPAEQELANRYRDAERQIRALREQFRAGQITRDQLQTELRRLMVLDENQVWWMMGIESDSWYRYENNQWVLARPAVLLKQETGAQPAVGQYAAPSPNDSAAFGGTGVGDALPRLVEDQARQAVADASGRIEEGATVPTSPIYEEADVPLPRPVPVQDPEATVIGTQGVYLNPLDPNAQPTVQNTAVTAVNPNITMPSPALQAQPNYDAVQSPIDAANAPPSYALSGATPTYEQVVEEERSRTIRTIALIATIAAALLFVVGALAIIGAVVYYNNLAEPWQDEIAALANYQPAFQTARILAADGSQIAELTSRSGGARQRIDLEDIAPELIHAVVSIENERFFEDPGFDPVAIGRAFIDNLTAGEVVSGASTITQQIARNLVLRDATVTSERKLQEIVIAAEIAQTYDKDFILELYLNEIFFGNQSYGVEAASQFYFGKSAADLTLPEAALLAGLIQAPATYDPVINRERSFDRMDEVLAQMVRVGCLNFRHAPYSGQQPFCVTQEQISSGTFAVQKAQVETASYLPRTFTVRYPHFVNYIQGQIEQIYGSPEEIFRRGMQIRTTLNPRIQNEAQNQLENAVTSLTNNAINTGAVLVMDPRSGAILAMIGSPDFSDENIDGQVNNVFTWQQPGSSIKPITYTAVLEGVQANGALRYMTPASILWDVPTTFTTIPPYTPVNFDGEYHGPVALRYALQNSYNVPAVKAFEFLGSARWLETAERMGLRFLPEAFLADGTLPLATSLGGVDVRLYDMMQAYGTLANNGVRVIPFSITGITDAQGNEIALPARTQPVQQVQPQIAFLMQNILSDNDARAAEFGTNSGLSLPEFPGLVAAKTGTSDGSRDLWTIGFTNNMVVGVWLGRHDNGVTLNTTQTSAVPVWNAVMRAALTGAAPTGWSNPGGVTQQQICATTGTLYDPAVPCPTVRTEIFLQSQLPPAATEGFVRTVAIDSWTRLRANANCPDNVVNETFASINDPTAIAWLSNTPQGQAYARSIGLPVPVQPIPANECQQGQALPQAGLSSPPNGATLIGVVQLAGTVQAPNFNRFQVEIAPANTNNFQIIAGPYNQQVNGQIFGEWNTTNAPNGTYTMRLAVFANDGGFAYRTIQVNVNNPPPTATPTITPTPSPTLFIVETPIPFDTPFGQQAVPGATATPQGFIPFGGLAPLGTPTPTATIQLGG